MHVLIGEGDDGQPEREMLLEGILVRVVRDVVHQQARGSAVEGTAGVVRDALVPLLLAPQPAGPRGGNVPRRASLGFLRLAPSLRGALVIVVRVAFVPPAGVLLVPVLVLVALGFFLVG